MHRFALIHANSFRFAQIGTNSSKLTQTCTDSRKLVLICTKLCWFRQTRKEANEQTNKIKNLRKQTNKQLNKKTKIFLSFHSFRSLWKDLFGNKNTHLCKFVRICASLHKSTLKQYWLELQHSIHAAILATAIIWRYQYYWYLFGSNILKFHKICHRSW